MMKMIAIVLVLAACGRSKDVTPTDKDTADRQAHEARFKAEDSEAHYHRACALARLGRSKQAMAALKRAIEIDEELADGISEEADLQSLARLPEFKALIPKDEPEPAKKEPDK